LTDTILLWQQSSLVMTSSNLLTLIKIVISGWVVITLCITFHLTTELDNSESFQLSFSEESSDVSTTTVASLPTSSAAVSASEHSQVVHQENHQPVTIAYAVSFIKCGDFQTQAAGLVDASIILRHSIHKISVRNPASKSKYDYKMYAIVHKDAEGCSAKLHDVGFEVVVVDRPVQQSEIRGEDLRKNVHREWCCGHDEFIKLYAYTLPEKIIVHVDIDYAFYKPMDHLFDAILFDKDSEEGRKARQSLELERPGEKLPDEIGAFITRDWTQVAPEKFPPGYQAGFIVARRDPTIMDEMVEVIKEGNYTDGWGRGHGWGGSGHGGYVGAMAMQGLVAYYYDHVRTGNAVELNQCRHNHMGTDVLYRNHPNYTPNRVKKEFLGGCRNAKEYCEDCQVTEFDKIYSVHYTQCRKPWQCMTQGAFKGRLPSGKRASAIDTGLVKLDHCLMLHREWHKLRSELERDLFKLTGDQTIFDSTKGTYKDDVFMGHCNEDGNEGYLLMTGTDETFKRIDELYNKS